MDLLVFDSAGTILTGWMCLANQHKKTLSCGIMRSNSFSLAICTLGIGNWRVIPSDWVWHIRHIFSTVKMANTRG